MIVNRKLLGRKSVNISARTNYYLKLPGIHLTLITGLTKEKRT